MVGKRTDDRSRDDRLCPRSIESPFNSMQTQTRLPHLPHQRNSFILAQRRLATGGSVNVGEGKVDGFVPLSFGGGEGGDGVFDAWNENLSGGSDQGGEDLDQVGHFTNRQRNGLE